MKSKIIELFNNETLLLLLNGVFAYIALTAVILAVLQVPPDAILDSGLDEILLVFEEFPDSE